MARSSVDRRAAQVVAVEAARSGEPVVVPPGATADHLAPLPVRVLEDVLDPDAVAGRVGVTSGGTPGGERFADLLRRLGIRTVGHLAALPAPDVSPLELASAGDNVADGHRTVAPFLAKRPGAPVLVVGGEAASVGLYAVLCALALGSARVDYLDRDRTRLELAERLGARPIDDRYRKREGAFPITVDASADPEGLAAAVLSAEPGGDVTSVGIYFARRTPFPLLPAFFNGVHFHTSRVCSRAELPAVLALIADGRLRPSRVTTLVARFDDAPEALLHRGPKVVLTAG
jgi:alcohol dehydrogenase